METLSPADDEVVFVQTFDAPRDLVWKAWTDPDMLRAWWGPHGCDTPECDIDLRIGGGYRIVSRAPDGTLYPVKGVYLEIEETRRLVMTDNSDDMPAYWRKAYNKRRKAADDAALAEIVLTLTLEDAGGGTKMTLSSRFATAADRDAFFKMNSEDTWRQSFEKMDAVLERN